MALRVALLGFIGTAIEWYDYYLFIYAALLAFPALFFPSSNYLVLTLAAVSSYAVAFFARPLGASVFGHLGDRLGRRHALSFDLILVGIAMILVGIMPPYSQIGIVAPIAIFALRFVQGLGVGGEWGGVATWVSEHTPSKRALITSLIQMASPVGFIGAATVLLAFSRDFATFGWRVGFIVGEVVALLGAVLRYLATESVPFEAIKARGEISRAPSIEVFRHAWKPIVLLMLAIGSVFMVIYIPATVMPSLYLKVVGKQLGYPAFVEFGGLQVPLTSALVYLFSLGGIVSIPIFGYLGDKLGRKTSLIIGDLLIVALAYPYVYGFLSGGLDLGLRSGVPHRLRRLRALCLHGGVLLRGVPDQVQVQRVELRHAVSCSCQGRINAHTPGSVARPVLPVPGELLNSGGFPGLLGSGVSTSHYAAQGDEGGFVNGGGKDSQLSPKYIPFFLLIFRTLLRGTTGQGGAPLSWREAAIQDQRL